MCMYVCMYICKPEVSWCVNEHARSLFNELTLKHDHCMFLTRRELASGSMANLCLLVCSRCKTRLSRSLAMHGSRVNVLQASAPGLSSVWGLQARNASLSPRWGFRDDLDTLLSKVGEAFYWYEETPKGVLWRCRGSGGSGGVASLVLVTYLVMRALASLTYGVHMTLRTHFCMHKLQKHLPMWCVRYVPVQMCTMCGSTCSTLWGCPPPLLVPLTCTHLRIHASADIYTQHTHTHARCHTCTTHARTHTHTHTHRICVGPLAPLSRMRASATTRRTTRVYVATPRPVPQSIHLAGIIGCQVRSFGQPLVVLSLVRIIILETFLLTFVWVWFSWLTPL